MTNYDGFFSRKTHESCEKYTDNNDKGYKECKENPHIRTYYDNYIGEKVTVPKPKFSEYAIENGAFTDVSKVKK